MENNMQPNPQLTGKNIKYLRDAQGWTQQKLASQLNVEPKTVSKWETGNGLPEIHILMTLSEIFKVTINVLLSEDISKTAHLKATSQSAMRLIKTGDIFPVNRNAVLLNELLKKDYKSWWKCTYQLKERDTIIWMVTIDGKERGGWTNNFENGKEYIRERYVGEGIPLPCDGYSYRAVFYKHENHFEFIGVYALQKDVTTLTMHLSKKFSDEFYI